VQLNCAGPLVATGKGAPEIAAAVAAVRQVAGLDRV
jgi:hypothetical protein